MTSRPATDRSSCVAACPMIGSPILNPSASAPPPMARPMPEPSTPTDRLRAIRMPSPKSASVMTGSHQPRVEAIA